MDKKWKEGTKKVWHFFWHSDSVWSWIANIIVAFLVIRYLIYPILGAALGTGYPIVAVVSESMEHELHNGILCGTQYGNFYSSYDNYWKGCGAWYENRNITKEEFANFPFKNGFDKGDVIIIWRASKENIDVGDVLVFKANKPQPIIHRVVKAWDENGTHYYQTKGDHNQNSIPSGLSETQINEDRVLGKGILRIPYLGWVKILFVDAVKPLGITITR